jgi:hypothetical protein
MEWQEECEYLVNRRALRSVTVVRRFSQLSPREYSAHATQMLRQH